MRMQRLNYSLLSSDLGRVVHSQPRTLRQLLIEANKAQGYDKPLAASLMQALARVLPYAPMVFDTIEHWPRDLASDGMVFRLNAGLHALALEGRSGALGRLYGVEGPPEMLPPRELDSALVAVLNKEAETLSAWLSHPTQTNEVARVAGLVAALLELGRDQAMPCEMLELGASAGLNLNFPHYAVEVAGRLTCTARSAVLVAPDWRGGTVPAGPLTVIAARGVDLHPLDVTDPADRQNLKAYIWPGDTERQHRLEAAIGLALDHPPRVEVGLASDWLARQLAIAPQSGVRRVVFHSMVLQYAGPAERAAIDKALALAATQATPDQPLARVSMEWRPDRKAAEIRIAQWDGAMMRGQSQLAAICHPYGEWIDWRGLP